jgi:hypothetical protein
MCGIMTWKVTPSVWIKVDKVAVCGSCGQVFESTSHMPQIMVSGKPSNRSARGVDIPRPPLVIWFFAHAPMCGNTFRTADRSTIM